jgi:hypothetical protein
MLADRNGGLMVDMGIIIPKDPGYERMTYAVGSELVVEWRALTVCLIDRIAEGVRTALGKTADEYASWSHLSWSHLCFFLFQNLFS